MARCNRLTRRVGWILITNLVCSGRVAVLFNSGGCCWRTPKRCCRWVGWSCEAYLFDFVKSHVSHVCDVQHLCHAWTREAPPPPARRILSPPVGGGAAAQAGPCATTPQSCVGEAPGVVAGEADLAGSGCKARLLAALLEG